MLFHPAPGTEPIMKRLHQTHSRFLLLGGLFCAVVACAAAAIAQPTSQTPKPAPVQSVPYEPLVLRVDADSEDWTLNAEVLLVGLTSDRQDINTSRPVFRTQKIIADAAVIVFPVPTDTAFTVMDDELLKSKLSLSGREIQGNPRLLDGYQANNRLLAWDLTDLDTNGIRLDVQTAMTSHKTVVDEKRAFQIDWPKNELPEMLNSALGPQLYIESDQPEIAKLVEVWTNGEPTKAKPYYLAKHLAAKVIDWYQPDEGPFLALRDSRAFETGSSAVMIAGYNVRGAVVAAREQKGSALDMANLLCAVYRQAGLPARVVICYDLESQKQDTRNSIHAWVEFFLMVDEERGLGEWVPVDIIRQREFSSRAPDVTRSWQYFGNNDKSQYYAPVSFHWHPPTMVVNSGPPALWGWLPKPSAPNVDQGIRFHAFNTPMTAERQRRRREGR